MIRVDAIWMAGEPQDMRAGLETMLARVVGVASHPHHAYLFANARRNRMKVLVQPMALASGWRPGA